MSDPQYDAVGLITGNTFRLRKILKSMAHFRDLGNGKNGWVLSYSRFLRLKSDYSSLCHSLGFQMLGTPEERMLLVISNPENKRIIRKFGDSIESGEIADGTAWHLCMRPETGELTIQNAETESTYWTALTKVYTFVSAAAWEQDFEMWEWEIEGRITQRFLATDTVHYYLAVDNATFHGEIPWPSEIFHAEKLISWLPTHDEVEKICSEISSAIGSLNEDEKYLMARWVNSGTVPQHVWLDDPEVGGVETHLYRHNNDFLAVTVGYDGPVKIVKTFAIDRQSYLCALRAHVIHYLRERKKRREDQAEKDAIQKSIDERLNWHRFKGAK